MLSKVITNKGHDWDKLPGPFLFAYKTMVHSYTGETLFLLLYGRDAKLPTALKFYLFTYLIQRYQSFTLNMAQFSSKN